MEYGYLKQVVGVSDMKVSTDLEDVLVTYSLGSCIGLTLYDQDLRIGGMVHTMLPLSRKNPERARANPAMFTDSGVMALIQELLDLGASKRNLVACAAGGAAVMDENGLFKIGERNYTTLKKVLWKNDILLRAEDIGGTQARTLSLYMEDGRTTVYADRTERELV